MRLEGRRLSENVEDRRRNPKRGPVAIGGIGLLIVVLIGAFFNIDVQPLVNQVQQGAPPAAGNVEGGERELTAEEEAQGVFVSQVLGLTEDVWGELLRQYGVRYEEPGLVLFSQVDESGCGVAQSATGPFYCPRDRKIYIDTSFFNDLQQRFGAPGDFARAYVIAHEVGHHIQNLLGWNNALDELRARGASRTEINQMSVRVELQADFLAGVFAHHLQGEDRILERGDIEEALRCAMQIGDDRLQKAAGGRVVPDSFTHGTSQQRQEWFLKGFESGDLAEAESVKTARL